MKKVLALLALSLATLPSLAEQYLMLHYRVGDGDIAYTAPNGGIVTSSASENDMRDVGDGKTAVCVESGGACSFTITDIPAGQTCAKWWTYIRTGYDEFYNIVILTNTTWLSVDPTATNAIWSYNDEANFKINTQIDYCIHIVADFDYITYTLNYNGNGGGDGMDQESHSYTNVFNLASNKFALTGYTFGGWTNETIMAALPDQSSVSGADFGVTYTNKTATLYAKWTPNTYTVTLDPGFDAATTSVTATYDSPWPALTVPERAGYRFLGWYNAASGGSLIDTNATYRTAANTTNYAHWAELVTATFKDGHTSTILKTETLDKGGTPTPPEAPEYAGYYSTGWKPAVSAISVNTTFTMEYAQYTYTVVFHADNGTAAAQTQQLTYNASEEPLNSVAAMGFSLTGYSFQNWTNSTGTAFADGQKVSNLAQSGEYHLHAVWSPISYTIEFNGNGADSGAVESIAAIYDQTNWLPKNGFVKAGRAFKSWRLASTGETYAEGAGVSNLTATAGATVTFDAVWSEPRYIAFDGNGASEAAAMAGDVMTFEGVDTKTLVSNKFEKTGYTFAGWATNKTAAAALSVAYTNGEEVVSTNLWLSLGETNVFYAVWQTNAYTVAFDPNGGAGTMAEQSFVYDQEQALFANAFTNLTGLAFAGWTNKVSGATYTNGEVVVNLTPTNGATVTLSALWDVGELSKAMHCDNLEWTSAESAGTHAGWTPTAGPGVGYGNSGSAACSKLTLAYEDTQGLQAMVTTGGKLSFKFKVENDSSITWLLPSGLAYSGPDSTGWYSVSDWVIGAPEEGKTRTIALQYQPMADATVYVYIDQMSWVPDGGTEPTEGNKPTIGVFAATAGGFTLTAGNVSDSFNYQILATNELVGGDWPVMTNLTSDVIGSGFTIVPEADEPTMFYKVKVIAK